LTDEQNNPEEMRESAQAEQESTAAAETHTAPADMQEKAPQNTAPVLVLTPKPVPPPKFDPFNPPPDKTAKKTAPAEVETFPFSVTVGKVYDGPMDLLLDLIRKQDIDIYDIPIARITAQFLSYVERLRETDVDTAGEFIYMASLLIHIKSKMLLPRTAVGPDEAVEDPRRELVERLLEHERFKNAAQMLQQKQLLEAASWTNPGMREFKDDAGAEPEIAADTGDLARVFATILERLRSRPILNVQEDQVTVGQMIQFLGRRLTMEDRPVSLHRLLGNTRSQRALVAMFLALLELVRLQAILLNQDRNFSEIFIKKNTEFENVINEIATRATDDWR
jgi:segregation and condensation protein A